MKIEVLDENDNKLTCDVIKIIKNDELNKMYVVYKDNDDILVSQLIKNENSFEIVPVLDNEWDFIEKNIGIRELD